MVSFIAIMVLSKGFAAEPPAFLSVPVLAIMCWTYETDRSAGLATLKGESTRGFKLDTDGDTDKADSSQGGAVGRSESKQGGSKKEDVEELLPAGQV